MIAEYDLTDKLDKGFAYGRTPYYIPLGYNVNLNCWQEPDGSWHPRYTYKKNSTVALGAPITSITCTNQDDMLCIAGGVPYYKNVNDTTWTACTWAGSGAAPTLSSNPNICRWCGIGNYVILSLGSTTLKTYKFYGSNFSSWDVLGGTGGVGASKGGLVIEHANCLLIAGVLSNRIDYSDAGLFETFSNYVNVGAATDRITDLYYNQGTLYVIKRESIWVKTDTFSDMTSANFRPLYYKDTCVGSEAAVLGDNAIYFANKEGIYMMQGMNITKISTPFDKAWQDWAAATSSPNFQMSYWRSLGVLMVSSIISGTAYNTLVFEPAKERWHYWTLPTIVDSCNCPANYRGFITVHKNDVYAYEWDDRIRVGDTGAEEANFLQVVKTPLLDFGAPHYEKYFRSFHLDALNVDYLLTAHQSAYTHTTPSTTIQITAPGVYNSMSATKPFTRAILQCYSTGGDMIVKNWSCLVNQRRKL